MEKLLLPSTIKVEDGDKPNAGRIVVTPCYHGYGTTLGNALRRVMLSSLPGAAVTAVKFRGVQHEFSTIDGVKEDVVEILLNLKQLRLRVHSEEPVLLQLSAKGVGVVTASQIEGTSDVEIINGDLQIATITDAKVTLELEITAQQGRGYVSVEEREQEQHDLGTIAVDAIYTPVLDVGYSVEFTRVGDVTNYEQLTLNVETDGTITPQDAVLQAVAILMDHLAIIQGGTESGGLGLEEDEPSGEEGEEPTENEEAAEEKQEEETAEETADESDDEETKKEE